MQNGVKGAEPEIGGVAEAEGVGSAKAKHLKIAKNVTHTEIPLYWPSFHAFNGQTSNIHYCSVVQILQ